MEYPGVPPVALPWAEANADRDADHWWVSAWTYSRGGDPIGMAVRVGGHLASAAHDMFLASSTPGRRLSEWVRRATSYGQHEYKLPLIPKSVALPATRPEIDLLRALVTILGVDERYRLALRDPDRVAQLASDLGLRVPGGLWTKDYFRRDRIDIAIALRFAGFAHRYRRPLPRDRLVPRDELVARTRARLDANPYRRGRPLPSDAEILRVADAQYYIDPWPFGALVDD